MSTITITDPHPILCSGGSPFYISCARCDKRKSSTDVYVIKERPWKYYCASSCAIFEAAEEEKLGNVVIWDLP
jgi:hypothetical protein